jgi:copper(I)-binding protein
MIARFLPLAAGLALVATASQALAGDVIAMHAFARATAPTAVNGAAFMVLMNQSDSDLAVVAAQTEVAERAELHTHIKDGGVMKMRHVDQIALPAGQEVVLQPGSFHIMLMGLKAPLVQGEQFALQLELSNGQSLAVSLPIESAGAMMTMDHGEMDHDDAEHEGEGHGTMGSSSKNNDSMLQGSGNHTGSGSKSE